MLISCQGTKDCEGGLKYQKLLFPMGKGKKKTSEGNMFLSVKLFIKRLAWCDMKEEIRVNTVFLTNEDFFFFFFYC